MIEDVRCGSTRARARARLFGRLFSAATAPLAPSLGGRSTGGHGLGHRKTDRNPLLLSLAWVERHRGFGHAPAVRRPHPGFLIGLAGSTLILTGGLFTTFVLLVVRSALDRGHVAGLPMLLAALPGLVVIAVVGRIVLSLLPAGPLGSHRVAALATTWAVSHLLGSLALAVEMTLLPPRPGPRYLALLLLPWVVIGAARIATLPGAMVPRHEPPREREQRSARRLRRAFAVVTALIPLWTLIVFSADPSPDYDPAFDPEHALPWSEIGAEQASPRRSFLLPTTPEVLVLLTGVGPAGHAAWRLVVPISVVALLVLVAHGLEQARRAPAGRSVCALALALALGPWAVSACDPGGELFLRAVGLGAGVALALSWVRRADRRALSLACLCFAGCALAGGPWLAAGGWCGLIAATARPARQRALVAGGSSALLAALVLWRALALDDRVRIGPVAAEAFGPDWLRLTTWFVLPAVGTAAIWFVYAVLFRRSDPSAPDRADEPTREWVAVGVPLLAGLVGMASLGAWPHGLAMTLLPVAAIFTALVLVRSERVRSA